jgi:hypothetical protein
MYCNSICRRWCLCGSPAHLVAGWSVHAVWLTIPPHHLSSFPYPNLLPPPSHDLVYPSVITSANSLFLAKGLSPNELLHLLASA